MAPVDEARKHLEAADKALKPSWSSFKFSPDHLTASMEYSQAATKFRAAGLLPESVDAWTKAAQSKEQTNDLFGAGRAYESAGAICDGTGPGGPVVASGYWQKAITCFRLCGKNEVAAKLILKLASHREKQGDSEGTKAAFKDAIEVFEQDEKDYELGDVFKQYIGYLIRSNDLEGALEAMDGHVQVLLRQKQPSFAHKELLSKVVLLLNLEDTVRAEQVLNATGDVEGWFMSKECQVASDLLSAFQNNDAEALASLVKSQTLTFLQIEVARIAQQLRIVSLAPSRVGHGGSASTDDPPSLADLIQ